MWMEGFVCEKVNEDKSASRCETSDWGLIGRLVSVSMNKSCLQWRLLINPSIKKYINQQLLIH